MRKREKEAIEATDIFVKKFTGSQQVVPVSVCMPSSLGRAEWINTPPSKLLSVEMPADQTGQDGVLNENVVVNIIMCT